eukprot:s1487_g13.t1
MCHDFSAAVQAADCCNSLGGGTSRFFMATFRFAFSFASFSSFVRCSAANRSNDVDTAAMARESGPRSNLAPPPGLTAQWETIAPLASLGAGTGHRSMMTRIKVTNLVRRLKSQEVQTVFERYVGPITHCNLVEDAASITFLSPDHAQAAIDRYDGGVMEVRTDKSAPGDPLVLYPKDSTFRRTLEDRLGPLTECHLRRGEGWMTLFRGSITKQLKREEALNQIDFKGSLINISFEVPTQPVQAPIAPQPAMVFGQPMVL